MCAMDGSHRSSGGSNAAHPESIHSLSVESPIARRSAPSAVNELSGELEGADDVSSLEEATRPEAARGTAHRRGRDAYTSSHRSFGRDRSPRRSRRERRSPKACETARRPSRSEWRSSGAFRRYVVAARASSSSRADRATPPERTRDGAGSRTPLAETASGTGCSGDVGGEQPPGGRAWTTRRAGTRQRRGAATVERFASAGGEASSALR